MASLRSIPLSAARSPGYAKRAGGKRAFAAVVAAALFSAALLLWAAGNMPFAGAFFAGVTGAAALWLYRTKTSPAYILEPIRAGDDMSLLHVALENAHAVMAVTDGEGKLRCANSGYSEWFGAVPIAPLDIPFSHSEDGQLLRTAATEARRHGSACVEGLRYDDMLLRADVTRAGAGEHQLLWKFSHARQTDLTHEACRLIEGEAGARAGDAGLMIVLADSEGKLISANHAFLARAFGDPDTIPSGKAFVDAFTMTEQGQFQFASEGKSGGAIRILQVPVSEKEGALTLFALLDESSGLGGLGQEGSASLNALLDFLPIGLALVNSDGRFVFLNRSFRKAAGLGLEARPIYPGDIVVDEDKAAVSDAVRRYARGRSVSSDIAVRLKFQPEEPVALTIAGARGLGDAAVVLSLKDTSEEDRLKKQVAQATKMQAVGQLAGGVAHDFNNILTAIIGYCDLMLMRHAPGDSDYDDIQQIKSNSNRAAGLTRQLLAFSRQQTLRPQVVQLPDVISEISNLLKRLLGETVKLQVKHGRNLGAVRADPGQLEQVIVNLAVNARDAIAAKGEGGGVLTLQTYAVSAEDARKMANDFLPIAHYTALRVTDTGVGISPNLLSKIFEPFFTTKKVGKGTGLGLSTVYGIVKQSGGYIFAESEPGAGASFVIYLPVFKERTTAPSTKRKAKSGAGELWGTGTILLVEDEAMVRAVAERALTRHGYTVLTAENGEVALELLASAEKVDLMISDVVMPNMDGPATVREARKSHPDLPILFISGYAEEQLRKSIDLEKVAFLAKPFSVQKLAEAARDALLQK